MITSSTGLGSGLDITGIVSQLVQAEIQPAANRLNRKEGKLQAQVSAVGTLKGAMSGFQAALGTLKGQVDFDARSASSSDATVADVSVTAAAATGNYQLAVTQLAATHSLVTDASIANGQFSSATSVLGTGTLTFKFGTTSYNSGTDTYSGFVQNPDKGAQTITITDGSLSGIQNAINSAGMGVSASIINDGSYFRLAITSTDGAASSMEITSSDADGNNTDAAGLSLLAFNSSATNMSQTAAGQDAQLTLNGIAISSASNTLASAVSGMTLTVKAIGSTAVSVNQDTTSGRAAIDSFVQAYNNLNKTMNSLSAYDPKTRTAGPLQGDVALLSIRSQLNAILARPVGGLSRNAPYRILADIGVTRSSIDGAMTVDTVKLNTAFQDHPQDVANLFGIEGVTTDINISYQGSLATTPVGTSAIDISSMASQGTLSGSAAANLTINSGVNDAVNLLVDGIAGSVTLTPNTYTATSLATEIQARVNGLQAFSTAGIAIKVIQNAGILTLSSNSYGMASQVDITGGNGKTGLLGVNPVLTAGTDIIGSVGATTGTGSGQELTGTGSAIGLKIKVSGGVAGARGTVTLTRGIADQMNNFLTSMLDTDGTLNDKSKSINSRISGINDDRAALLRRQDSLQARLKKQFIAMDALVGQLRATSSALTSQLAAIDQISAVKKS